MTKEEAMLHMILRREELKHSVGDLDEDIKAFDMAIEALEQKPCEDAISRSEVLDLIDSKDPNYEVRNFKEDVECLDPIYTCTEDIPCTECSQYDKEKNYCPHFCHVIRDVFQEKTGRWIPVSEKLPKPYQPILVTSEAFHWANEPVRYFVKQTSFGGVVDFIAWMPLPQPYKGESEVPDADSD